MKNWIKRQLRALRRAWRSWTMNWGVALIVVGYFHDHIDDFMPLLGTIIPDKYVAAFVQAIGLIIILLRMKTDKALADK